MARPWCWCWVWCRRRWSAPVGLQPGMPRGQRFVAEHCLLLCWAAACATRQRTVRHGCLLRHCATALLRYCATALLPHGFPPFFFHSPPPPLLGSPALRRLCPPAPGFPNFFFTGGRAAAARPWRQPPERSPSAAA